MPLREGSDVTEHSSVEVAQGLRGLRGWLSGKEPRLPVQETQVRSGVQEDPTFQGAAEPLGRNY